jgi:predicted small secreted protein
MMKKTLLLMTAALVLALLFAGCPTESGGDADSLKIKKDSFLKIKNESFTEITDVLWQDVSFTNNAYENSIKSGTSVTQSVKASGRTLWKPMPTSKHELANLTVASDESRLTRMSMADLRALRDR